MSFQGYLRQNTAAGLVLGPFVDATDGYSHENGLTLLRFGNVTLYKNGVTDLLNTTAGSLASSGNGMYSLSLEAADTDIVGRLKVLVYDEGNTRPLAFTWAVLPANVYDSLIAGSDALQVDTIQVSGTVQTAGDIPALVTTVDTVVDAILVDTGTTLPASLSYAKDDVNDKRTWTFTKNTNSTKSPRIVTVHPDFDGTLKFDLSNMLNTGAGINAITSVTVDPTGPTVGATSKTSDNKSVLFDIDGAQIDNTDYTFTCTVTTTDSDDALIVTGVMKSRSS